MTRLGNITKAECDRVGFFLFPPPVIIHMVTATDSPRNSLSPEMYLTDAQTNVQMSRCREIIDSKFAYRKYSDTNFDAFGKSFGTKCTVDNESDKTYSAHSSLDSLVE